MGNIEATVGFLLGERGGEDTTNKTLSKHHEEGVGHVFRDVEVSGNDC